VSKPSREIVEAMVNLATNGALDRIDQRGKRACELYQWGLHPHHPDPGSPLAADDAAFQAAYPLALSGGVGVTEESIFPLMSASENLNAAGLLVQHRAGSGSVHASSIMQLCRSAMEGSARTIWILGDPDRAVRRDRALNVLVEQLEQQKRFLKIEEDNANWGRIPRRRTLLLRSEIGRQPVCNTGVSLRLKALCRKAFADTLAYVR
jgi:hypothetical protein